MPTQDSLRPGALITGVAGFIGSTLAEFLLGHGTRVVGVDCFTAYYGRPVKEANIHPLFSNPLFEFIEADLASCAIGPVLDSLKGPFVVYHLAGQPGVRPSSAVDGRYTRDNVLTTRRLLGAVGQREVEKFVLASSSSVYGRAGRLPLTECQPTEPISPYGESKLKAERACMTAWHRRGVPAVVARLFTAFGPRQRPDMAFHRFVSAMKAGREVDIYGDGTQTRDFTYVSDAVAGLILCANAPAGQVFNIAGGRSYELLRVVEVIERLCSIRAVLSKHSASPYDPSYTSASIAKAQTILGYRPMVDLENGLAEQIRWMESCP